MDISRFSLVQLGGAIGRHSLAENWFAIAAETFVEFIADQHHGFRLARLNHTLAVSQLEGVVRPVCFASHFLRFDRVLRRLACQLVNFMRQPRERQLQTHTRPWIRHNGFAILDGRRELQVMVNPSYAADDPRTHIGSAMLGKSLGREFPPPVSDAVVDAEIREALNKHANGIGPLTVQHSVRNRVPHGNGHY